MRSIFRKGCLALALFASVSFAQPPEAPISWESALKEPITATVEPARARRGQTVAVQITLDLNAEYYSYSLKQTDAESLSSAPQFTFPPGEAGLRPVGDPGERATEKKTFDGSNILEGK